MRWPSAKYSSSNVWATASSSGRDRSAKSASPARVSINSTRLAINSLDAPKLESWRVEELERASSTYQLSNSSILFQGLPLLYFAGEPIGRSREEPLTDFG